MISGRSTSSERACSRNTRRLPSADGTTGGNGEQQSAYCNGSTRGKRKYAILVNVRRGAIHRPSLSKSLCRVNLVTEVAMTSEPSRARK